MSARGAGGLLRAVTAPEPDAVLRVMRAFAEDPRPDKIDLGVGVYRDAAGRAPVMAAVRGAEERILARQTTKSYTALAGDPAFLEAIGGLVLGDAVPGQRVAALATPGGTGAVRQALDLVRLTAQEAGRAPAVWISDPSWPNHAAILSAIGQPFRRYRWLDRATGGLDRAGLFEDLGRMAAGDVLVLHGCCHNPSGVDLAAADWDALARLCAARGVLPVVDLAYQGFGAGVAADVAGLRALAAALPEMLVAVSGSKTFALYRERVGAVLAVCDAAAARDRVAARLAGLNRQAYAFPPDHGARVVTEVLTSPDLRTAWEADLAAMRARIAAMRQGLAEALRAETGADRFGALAAQAGLFSLLPATPREMERLRVEHGLYGVEDGRINLAGLTPATLAPAARAIAAVLGPGP